MKARPCFGAVVMRAISGKREGDRRKQSKGVPMVLSGCFFSKFSKGTQDIMTSYPSLSSY